MNTVELLQNSFSNFFSQIVGRIPNLLAALLVFSVFLLAGLLVRRLLDGGRSARTRRRALVGRIVQTALFILGIAFGLSIAGLNVTGVLTGVGLVTVGLSFSFQDILVNYIAGLELLGQAPFELGDHIEVGNVQGIVRKIGTRSTILDGENGTRIAIPNRDLLTKPVKTLRRARRHV
jgi:small conductance mechanosensitive channel